MSTLYSPAHRALQDEFDTRRLADMMEGGFTVTEFGDADKAVPVERSRSMVSAVKAAGGSPTYVEMPGVGHDSWSPAYRNPAVLDWLFAQRRR